MSISLVDAMYEAFSSSKRWFNGSLIGSIVITVLTVIMAFNPDKKVVIACTVASALLQIGVFVFKMVGEEKFDVAEQMRRLNTISDGFGTPLSSIQLAKLLHRTGTASFPPSPASSSYFESSSPPGPQRMLEILLESSFWTSCLAGAACKYFLWISLVGLGVAITALVMLGLTASDQATTQVFTSAILPLIAFWSASDILSMSLKFRKLNQETDKICDAVATALRSSKGNSDQFEALVLLSDYNCAVVSSPPIPGWIYNIKKPLLNQLWRQRSTTP